MANQWLRLWHEMPNDPKWRTVARIAAQPISLVQAVYLHLLVDASRNVTRGHATVTHEDLASALDVTENAICDVLHAMQGRVLDEMRLLGWDARQPKREDTGDGSTGAKSAAQRKADQRAREKQAPRDEEEKPSHDASRKVTLDKEKKREEKLNSVPDGTDGGAPASAAQMHPPPASPVVPPPSPISPGKSPEEMAKAELWRAAVSVLEGGGCPVSQCRTFMGKLVQDYTFPVVQKAVANAVAAQPADAREYLKAACQAQSGQRATPNKQEALEARGQAVVDAWANEGAVDAAA